MIRKTKPIRKIMHYGNHKFLFLLIMFIKIDKSTKTTTVLFEKKQENFKKYNHVFVKPIYLTK